VNEILLAAAAGLAVASSLLAIVSLWALSRLRRHHRALAASYEEQQRQLQRLAERHRDELREVERRGERALVERFAAVEAVARQRDRVREALDEILAAAAVGRLGAQPTRVLVGHLQHLDRELSGAGSE
jgi:biopolymer transport protein ExbB/TolQ